ncbi:MAG: AAA family ATPase [Acidithiobacillus sp.]|nr:AAA family ATPase [Acidithiobacillus sp.]
MSTMVDLGSAFSVSELAGKKFPSKDGAARVPNPIPGYAFRLDLLRKVMLWVSGAVGSSLYLGGPAGSGKTSVIEQVAARLGWGCTTLSCNTRTERADIVGYLGLKNGATAFIDGPLVRAMRFGEIILFDEGDALPPSVTIILNRVLEGSSLVIPETGDTVVPHPDFRIAFTGNTKGRGDATGNFRARQVQDAAVLDRFLFVEVDYPTPEEEEKIVANRFPSFPEVTRKLIVRLAAETRQAHMAGDLSAPLSTRGILRIVSILESGIFRQSKNPLLDSLGFGFADGLAPDEKDGIFKMYEAIQAA